MMVEVSVTVTTSVITKVDVEFPIYRHHEVDSDDYPTTDIWMRVDMLPGAVQRFTEFSITRRPLGWHGDDLSYELKRRPTAFGSHDGIDYALGRGEYACTPAEFAKAFADAMHWAAQQMGVVE